MIQPRVQFTPLAEVRLLKGGDIWNWAVGVCPHCYEPHLHGGTYLRSTQHPREALTWRLAKCRKSAVKATVREQGYKLVEEDRDETDRLVAEYAERGKARRKAKGPEVGA
jgi:hypothetical protein